MERDKTYYKNLVDDAFITQKLREKTLKETILKNTRALWRYNKIFRQMRKIKVHLLLQYTE